MQTVSSAFTAEERDTVRQLAHNLQVSWQKERNLGSRTFTIGSSTIGGRDVIGINPGALGGPNIYRYFDESAYVVSMAWERGLNLPVGGLSKAFAEAVLDNTSDRFTPEWMGGRGELYTAIESRKPMILQSGFKVNGVDSVVPQFVGILDRQPEINARTKEARIHASDYIDFFENRYLDQTVMFTGQPTDRVIETLLQQQGLATAQYNLDAGINTIPFGLFESGSKFGDVIHEVVKAENGQFYQDEQGIFRFENRQHWDSAPYTQVQRIIATAQVLNSETPTDEHIINVVEVKGTPREKQSNQLVWQSTGFAGSGLLTLAPNSQQEIWVNFDDPMLSIDTPAPVNTSTTSFFVANDNQDGTGTDMTASVYLKYIEKFATTAKLIFVNTASTTVYIINLDIWGRPARRTGNIYFRSERGLSVTAYEERALTIESEFIQSQSWAQTYGELVLQDFAFPERIIKLTIRAIPEMQRGDLVSWQGRNWRIYDIKSTLDASVGYIQELTMVQRVLATYFRIGISTIGGTDKIAP